MEKKSFLERIKGVLVSSGRVVVPFLIKAGRFIWKYLKIAAEYLWLGIVIIARFLFNQVNKLWNFEPHGKKIVLGSGGLIVVIIALAILINPPKLVDTVTVNQMYPTTVTKGSLVTIIGDGLVDQSIEKITVNGKEVGIRSVQSGEITFSLLENNKSGEVRIYYQDNTFAVIGELVVEEFETVELYSERIKDNSTELVFDAGEIEIKVPAETIGSRETLSIEKIQNAPDGILTDSDEYDLYSINIGNIHEFDQTLEITFEVDGSYVPLVVYFDEETGVWEIMDSASNEDGTYTIYTNHLTDIAILKNYHMASSPEGRYMVYYSVNDTYNVPGLSSMTELAETAAKALEDSQAKFNNVLDDSMDYNQTVISSPKLFGYQYSKIIPQRVLMTSNHNQKIDWDPLTSDGSSYSVFTGMIYLATEYDSVQLLKLNAAHELFHKYQNKQLSMVTMIRNMWLMEALAEYAANAVAYPNGDGVVKLRSGDTTMSKYDEVDGLHEYNMSAFIDFMLKKNNLSFGDLWKFLVEENEAGAKMDDELIQFIANDSRVEFLEGYKEFYLKAISDNSPVILDDPATLVETIADKEGNANITKLVKFSSEGQQKFFRLYSTKYQPYVERRFIRVDSTNISRSDWSKVDYVNIPGDFTSTSISDYRIDGGWELSEGFTKQDEYFTIELLKMNPRYMTIINVIPDKYEDIELRFREIYGTISQEDKTNKTEFTVEYEKLFEEINIYRVEINYGDGEVEKDTFRTSTYKKVFEHAYAEEVQEVTVSLYNHRTDELVHEIVFREGLEVSVSLDLSADKSETMVGEEITFTSNITDMNYTYSWNFGNGDLVENGHPVEKKVFSEPGDYIVELFIYEGTELLTSDSVNVIILGEEEEPSGEEDIAELTASSVYAAIGEEITFQTDIVEEGYTYLWSFGDGILENGEDHIVTKSYDEEGIYSVKLIVNGDTGSVAVLFIDVEIYKEYPTEDPYRQYDDGVIEYNYDEMTWETNGLRTWYIKKETGELHGMYFSTYDGIVENGITGITYYYDGEEIRHVDYYEYPQIKSDTRYFDTWTQEDYTYYESTGNVWEYFKDELIDDNWKLVERIRYYENGTIDFRTTYGALSQTNENYYENGMLASEMTLEYPSYEVYSYFEDGSLSYKLVGTINTNNYSFEEFVDGRFNNPPYHLYTSAVYENYSAPGILMESAIYGEMTQIWREYDENGVITYEKEGEYIDYNTTILLIERIFSEGELHSESCWDADGYNFCGSD